MSQIFNVHIEKGKVQKIYRITYNNNYYNMLGAASVESWIKSLQCSRLFHYYMRVSFNSLQNCVVWCYIHVYIKGIQRKNTIIKYISFLVTMRNIVIGFSRLLRTPIFIFIMVQCFLANTIYSRLWSEKYKSIKTIPRIYQTTLVVIGLLSHGFPSEATPS